MGTIEASKQANTIGSFFYLIKHAEIEREKYTKLAHFEFASGRGDRLLEPRCCLRHINCDANIFNLSFSMQFDGKKKLAEQENE